MQRKWTAARSKKNVILGAKKMTNCRFFPGQRVAFGEKRGTVERLRDDAYERERRASNPHHFFYSVSFDDGTFDTYVAQSYLTAA
jgi:hypothetical protein